MFENYLISNVIYSILAGIAVGLLVGLVYKRPRGWIAFGLLVLLNMLSPWIGGPKCIVYGCDDPTSFTIHCNVFLFGLLLTINICFLVRLILGRQPVLKV